MRVLRGVIQQREAADASAVSRMRHVTVCSLASLHFTYLFVAPPTHPLFQATIGCLWSENPCLHGSMSRSFFQNAAEILVLLGSEQRSRFPAMCEFQRTALAPQGSACPIALTSLHLHCLLTHPIPLLLPTVSPPHNSPPPASHPLSSHSQPASAFPPLSPLLQPPPAPSASSCYTGMHDPDLHAECALIASSN